MAIVTDEYIEYNTTNRFYYFTEAGLIKYTNREYLIDLWEINQGATARRLETQGRMLKNKCTNNVNNNNYPRYRHRDIIEYNIFKDELGERDAIIQSLTEMVYASEDDDWDKKIRLGQTEWLPMILNPVSNVGVYFTGKIPFVVPEDEYEVGY